MNHPKEERDLAATEPRSLARLQAYLAGWQRSVEKDLEAYPEARQHLQFYPDYQVFR